MSGYDGHTVKRQRLNDSSSVGKSVEYNGNRKYREPEQPNKILLFTIVNAVYPITTEILHTICQPCGDVQRIVIFRKRGVQAMVEFDSIQTAQRAKASLNGADIYSGCCTLKIEWAKPERLNVYKNDDETWDYTVPAAEVKPEPQAPLLGVAPAGYAPPPVHNYPPQPMSGGMRPRMPMPPRRGTVRPSMPVRGARPAMAPMQQPHYDPYNGGSNEYNVPQEVVPSGPTAYSQSPVVMIYGLNPTKMNCKKLFNVLCLYGNVMKVKFLRSKPGTAMVQMGDALSVDRAIAGLSGMQFFDDKLVLAPSKQMYLTDGNPNSQSTELDDGTPAQHDFSGDRNNRFMTAKQAEKNREQNPSKVLHYYNAPTDFDELKMKDICEVLDIVTPVRFLSFKSKNDRTSSGLIEFESKPQALECLSFVNHYEIENPGGKWPFIVKFCFSSASSATAREQREPRHH